MVWIQPASYHSLKIFSAGSHQSPPLLGTAAALRGALISNSVSGFSTGLPAYLTGVWKTRFRPLVSTRKSSTNSCRPTSIGTTAGRVSR